MKFEQTLKDLGFTDGEIKVYFALVKLGSTTVGPIIDEAQVSNSKVYILLEKLIKKGVVSYITKGKTKYFQASPPKSLLGVVKKKEREISKIKGSLGEVIRYIEENKERTKEEARIYKGYDGMKNAWSEAVKSIPKGEHYYFFSKGYGEDQYLKSFFRNLSAELKKKKIKIFGLANKKEGKYFERFYKKLGYNMRYTNHNWPADTTIAGEFLLIFVWSKESPTVYSIQSRILIESYKGFFEELWGRAKRES
jgi:HTH-type transcriptional regulator, sugar sensing transcriptional regulator